MTKIRYKAVLAALAIASLAVSGDALAAARGNRSNDASDAVGGKAGTASSAKAQASEQFCERIGNLKDDVVGNLEKGIAEAETRMSQYQDRWQDRISQLDSDIDGYRSAHDTNIEANFSKLEERATTDEQKAAVSEFEETVKAAIETRRDAVDAARETFRESVKGLISERQESLEASVARFREAVATAVSKAGTDCSAGVSAQQVRTSLRASISSAHSEFVADRSSAGIGEEVAALAKTRNEAVQKAMTEFKNTIEDAAGKLKEAFPEG